MIEQAPTRSSGGFKHLWAKTDREHPDPDRYHALALHLVDVAVVTHELWRTSWSPYRRRRWAAALGGDEELAGRWLAFIAGLHDLGKASPIFQVQAPDQLERINREAGQAFRPRQYPTPLPHGLITAGTLPPLLKERFGMGTRVAKRLGLVTGAHHGLFATAGSLRTSRPGGGNDDQLGNGVWNIWRGDLVNYLARAVGLPATLPDGLMTRRLNYADAEELAGMISYADWIGSDVRYFPLTPTVPDDPAAAWDDSTAKAERALDALQFDTPAIPIPSETLTGMFAHIRVPNAGQDAAMRAMADLDGPAIAVVEYPMGWGKTEIALWMAARWAQREQIDGFYVAMPTRTTSDQLYTRVHALLSEHGRRNGIEPQLIRVSGQTPLSVDMDQMLADVATEAGIYAHADAAVDPTGQDGQRRGSADSDGAWRSAVASSRVEAFRRAQWFGRRSRGLLARYGVGTVDQAMLGVLTTRHGFVRLAGLAGRSVIFDEVHSYDVYMSTIVDRLLSFLGAMGSPVVILTATLPKHRTQQLIAAYTGGAGWNASEVEIATYPRLTVASHAGGQASVPVTAPVDDDRPPLRLERLPHDVEDEAGQWGTVAERLQVALAGGGTAAVVCNTVAQAQDAFRTLAEVFPVNELEVFHARFRQRERRMIQERVLRDFGKQAPDRPPTRPRRRIVIATQVIEQSLDLDFDLMVSMFCPADLLLQRSGRLQRHRTTDPLRPAGLRQPRLWLIGYDESGEVPRFARGSEAVYGAFPLLRSWWALGGRETVAIPEDIEALIETAYAEDDAAPDEAPWLRSAWEEARCAFTAKRDDEEREAGKQLILALEQDQPDVGNDALTAERSISAPADELPPDKAAFGARTRLGPPSVTAVVLSSKEAEDLVVAVTPAQDKREKAIPARVVAELLERSVTISTVGLTRELIAAAPPNHWADVPALRFARLVLLDDGRCQVGERWSLRLDARIGLLAERAAGAARAPIEEEE